jgi:hypothetical protein
MMTLEAAIKITLLHAQRLRFAYEKLAPIFPLKPHQLETLTEEELLLIELLTSRFAKLQDHMGAQLFGLILEKTEELVDRYSWIDKINLLEKRQVIESAYEWREFRKIRNSLSHEYPDNMELMAFNLNSTYQATERLLYYANQVSHFAHSICP